MGLLCYGIGLVIGIIGGLFLAPVLRRKGITQDTIEAHLADAAKSSVSAVENEGLRLKMLVQQAVAAVKAKV